MNDKRLNEGKKDHDPVLKIKKRDKGKNRYKEDKEITNFTSLDSIKNAK
jgi:hypothetical protein